MGVGGREGVGVRWGGRGWRVRGGGVEAGRLGVEVGRLRRMGLEELELRLELGVEVGLVRLGQLKLGLEVEVRAEWGQAGAEIQVWEGTDGPQLDTERGKRLEVQGRKRYCWRDRETHCRLAGR